MKLFYHIFIFKAYIYSKYKIIIFISITKLHMEERIAQSKRDILAVSVISNDLFIVVTLQLTSLHLLGWTIWYAYGTYGAEIRRKHVC